MTETLDCGDLIVEDAGRLGINIVSKDGKHLAFFNAKGAAHLKNWLETRETATFPAVNNDDWARRFELARKVAEAVERDLVREIERLRGERDRLADRLETSQRNLEGSRAQYSEMVRARNAACSIADDAAQLRDDAFEWLAKIDEIRKIGF